MIYTLTPNPSLDYILHTPDFAPGRINRTSGEEIYPGGKGINVSLVLKELGHESCALGFAAGFTGEELARRLGELGVKEELIRLPAGMTRINVKLRCEPETEINGAGPEIPGSAYAALLERISGLEPGDILVLAGSLPPSLPEDAYAKIAKIAGSRGVRIAADTRGAALLKILEHRPFLIKPNIHELGELFGKTLDISDVPEYAGELHRNGAENVLVSCGGAGAYLHSADCSVFCPAHAGEAVNTVGAGDSCVAGFISGTLRGLSAEESLKLSVAAGSATAFNVWLASKQDIIRMYNI